jgi:HAD superfamily hydrolase (TIGR01509 family)
MIKALIFDFDGLILDTETPEEVVWASIYREHGHEFPLGEWMKTIGGYGISNFDPAEHLARLTQLDAAPLRARYRAEADVVINSNPILPGVEEMMDAAQKRGLKLAIASSSPHSWVDPHLARLRLAPRFDRVICGDDVASGRTKPNPDLFLLALDRLGVPNEAAIVFEDSPNGVRAAKAAGIFVVAVPNPLTERMGVDGADLTVKSLADLSLTDLLSRVNGRA